MTKGKGNQKGFTLIELIMVMALLAILAGLAVPRFTSVLTNANEKANAANLKMLQDAVDLLESDLAADGQALPTGLTVENLKVGITINSKTYGPYIKSVPTPPQGHKVYTIESGIVKNTDP
ncbi:MAG: prepilin-type N-terminal cleavage/methylation domain-containing protein [Syntrophomonas sp.]